MSEVLGVSMIVSYLSVFLAQNTVDLLMKDHPDERPDERPTTLMRDHPDERLTTLMRDRPP